MALASSTGISTNPIPMGRTVSYGCIIILWYRLRQNNHSKGHSQITIWSLSCVKVMAHSIRWLSISQMYLSTLFSCQRTVGIYLPIKDHNDLWA